MSFNGKVPVVQAEPEAAVLIGQHTTISVYTRAWGALHSLQTSSETDFIISQFPFNVVSGMKCAVQLFHVLSHFDGTFCGFLEFLISKSARNG